MSPRPDDEHASAVVGGGHFAAWPEVAFGVLEGPAHAHGPAGVHQPLGDIQTIGDSAVALGGVQGVLNLAGVAFLKAGGPAAFRADALGRDAGPDDRPIALPAPRVRVAVGVEEE